MVPAFEKLNLPARLARELRSAHAGKAAVVSFYKGVLASTTDETIRATACDRLETEKGHLDFFEDWIPKNFQSWLAPIWSLLGWMLGALAALFGRRSALATMDGVDASLDRHYASTVAAIEANPYWEPLRQQIQQFREDEIAHIDDTAHHLVFVRPGIMSRLWSQLVTGGYSAGAFAARHI